MTIKAIKAISKKVLVQFGVFGALLLALFVLMAIIVLPIVAFAKNATMFYSIFSIALIFVGLGFLVVRKYRNLVELELANTRDDKEEKSMKRVLLFKILIKPILIVSINSLYAVIFFTFNFAILAPAVAFFLLTFVIAFMEVKKTFVY